ncbi:uncharacterized protein DNG_07320 [Cephalotrichum gorgonifer]|uniref:Ankyrin n=1 Tax=Cephalotrichum gorgonifer TaxID=2041049 RepID=A0AAE8SXA4_9PEZI|nr:uncharacterized protein DNG_07320 [Cephalotrichum gorgonifer]
MPYRTRHGPPCPSAPAIFRYRPETRIAFRNTLLWLGEEYKARVEAFEKRTKEAKTPFDQADRQEWDDLLARKEDCEDARCAPCRREVEGYFASLPPLPPLPPLAKSSLWFTTTNLSHYEPSVVRPFYVACHEGQLDKVREWMARKDVLKPIGLRDGLDCAAMGNQVHVVRFLLEEGIPLSSQAVVAACNNLSLPLFELFFEYGYHPNQQVPSYRGVCGTSLMHCLASEPLTRFLLEKGADPNMARFMDGRNAIYSPRSTPPLDRRSGLPLDIAVEKASLGVVQMLLEHGAKPKYSRPLERIVRRRPDHFPTDTDEWRPLMVLLLQYGADVNAASWGGGTALSAALWKERWDVVEFLLERGADPGKETPCSRENSFKVAAKRAGIEWEETEGLAAYLDWLCESVRRDESEPVPEDIYPSEGVPVSEGVATPAIASAPDGAEKNPLVQVMERMISTRYGEKATKADGV